VRHTFSEYSSGYTCVDRVVVILGFDNGDRDVGLVIEDVVSALLRSSCMKFSPDINPPISKANFLANLCVDVPSRRQNVGRDEFGANVSFAEGSLIHRPSRVLIFQRLLNIQCQCSNCFLTVPAAPRKPCLVPGTISHMFYRITNPLEYRYRLAASLSSSSACNVHRKLFTIFGS
jgi:hypothetical protein